MEEHSGRRLRFFSPDGTFEEAIARFMKFTLLAFLVASVIHLELAFRYGSGNILRLDGTPVGIALSLGLLTVLWKWPHRLRFVVITAYAALTVGLTFKLTYLVFWGEENLLTQLLWMLPWMTISTVLSFILFSGRVAAVLSACVLVFWAVISGVYVTSHIASPQGHQALLFFSQADIAECVFIIFMGLFPRLLGLYLLSHKSALHLSEMANTDFLLDLPNRRAIQSVLSGELLRAGQTGGRVTIAMMDIDRFKQVNDRFGHDAGDAVLRIVTRTAQEAVSPTCVFGRWGGDEFLVIAPNLTREGAIPLAEKARRAVAELNLDVGQVTVSFGIAESRAQETVVSFLKRADEALYRAKKLGRNRVEWEWASVQGAAISGVEHEGLM